MGCGKGWPWLWARPRPSLAGAHVEGLEALRVHALRVIHLVIVLMVVVVIVVIICCGGPAHRQVLRAATDLSFDGIVAPRAIGGGLREGQRQRSGQALFWPLTGHGELGAWDGEHTQLPCKPQLHGPSKAPSAPPSSVKWDSNAPTPLPGQQ